MAVELLAAQVQETMAGGSSSAWWVKGLGWVGQAFFFGRVMVQWVASERARRPVAPQIFWYLSVAGALLLSAYSVLRGEIVLVPGYVVTLFIYLRNLWIARRGTGAERLSPLYMVLIGVAVSIVPYALGLLDSQGRTAPSWPWLTLAIVGQTFWIGRFLLQWQHAERHGKSEFPTAFWWLTIAGSGLLSVYSLHRVDFVFIFGFVTSWVAPVRNLMLHHKHTNATS